MKHRLQTLAGLMFAAVTLGVSAQSCDDAWADYNEFKKRNKMEPSQYALTTYGATVRAACGADALPVPPGTDTPRYPIVRKPQKPSPPPPPPKPKASP